MDILEKLDKQLEDKKEERVDEVKKAKVTDISWIEKGGHIRLYISPNTRDDDTINTMVQKLAKQYKANIMD